MSADEDRAAKAARARALMAKKKAQKAGGVTPNTDARSVASPSPPPSRRGTPAPVEVHSPIAPPSTSSPLSAPSESRSNGRNLGDLFAKESGPADSNNWLSGLPRVDDSAPSPSPPIPAWSPPPPSAVSPKPTPISSPPPRSAIHPPTSPPVAASEHRQLREIVQKQQQTIGSLEAEKADLTEMVEKLKSVDSELQATTKQLEDHKIMITNAHNQTRRTMEEMGKAQKAHRDAEIKIGQMTMERENIFKHLQKLDAEITKLAHVQVEYKKLELRGLELQAANAQTTSELGKASQQVQEQQTRISSLEDEKAGLTGRIRRLEPFEKKTHELEQALEEERSTSRSRQDRVYELERSLEEANNHAEQQQQTITLLVAEKTNLTASLERLQDADTRLQQTSHELEQERLRAAELQTSVRHLEEEEREWTHKFEEVSDREKELASRCHDQERELQLLTASVDDSRSKSEELQRRVRELEEQIESDDRAERLEATLQHTQDRAAELELQVSKLKQAQSSLKAERDGLEKQLEEQTEREADLQGKHDATMKLHEEVQERLSSLTSERDQLLHDKTELEQKMADNGLSVSELQQKLATTVAELTTSVRTLQQTQAELRNANRRAEEAEKIQKDLQAEGIGLMRSLEEMRPKIVELTDAKLDLGEKVESLEKALGARDSMIAQLESSVEDLRDQIDAAEKKHQDTTVALERERTSSHVNSSELQKAYGELQDELQAARESVEKVEAERSAYREASNRQAEEVDKLSASLQSHIEELNMLRTETEERNDARREAEDFLERARTEMEGIRAELAAKEEEVERLQHELKQRVTSSPNADFTAAAAANGIDQADTSSGSLNEEMLSAIKQQHALEMSAAQSQIRSLETGVFQAEAKTHSLQRQLSFMEEQLAGYQRSSSRASQRPGLPMRTNSRGVVDHSSDLRRASFSSHRNGQFPHHLAPAVTPAIDGLSPETRHKRKVSLSMLKARIDSEAKAESRRSSPVVKPVSLPTVVEPPSRPATPPVHVHLPRKAHNQFLDEAHIFWCSSCQGDLVVL